MPPHAIEDRPEGGPFGVRVGETLADVHAVHVSELGRAEADASDTDPALLWFDVSEAQAALRYRDRQD